MSQHLSRFLFTIAIASCAVTTATVIINCALQGSVFFNYAPQSSPEIIKAQNAKGIWIQMTRKRPDDYFYFSYERYRIQANSTVQRNNLSQFFIPRVEIFSYYNTEGRRFGLLTATDAETNAKYSCWITRPSGKILPTIDSDCMIPETAILSSLEITLLRPTGFKEKLLLLKKTLYG